MRKPILVLCVAFLLVAVLAAPVAAPPWAVIDPAPQPAPATAIAAVAGEAPVPAVSQAALVALLLFRGPPSSPAGSEPSYGNPDREESECGGDGWRRC